MAGATWELDSDRVGRIVNRPINFVVANQPKELGGKRGKNADYQVVIIIRASNKLRASYLRGGVHERRVVLLGMTPSWTDMAL